MPQWPLQIRTHLLGRMVLQNLRIITATSSGTDSNSWARLMKCNVADVGFSQNFNVGLFIVYCIIWLGYSFGSSALLLSLVQTRGFFSSLGASNIFIFLLRYSSITSFSMELKVTKHNLLQIRAWERISKVKRKQKKNKFTNNKADDEDNNMNDGGQIRILSSNW